MDRLKLFALAIGSWIFAPALTAQSFPDWFLIPCEDSPPGAVMEIPEPLNQFASVQCTVFGHVITGSSEYNWSYSASFHSGPESHFVPAQEYVDGKLTESAHENYFTSITAEEFENDRLEEVFFAVTGHPAPVDPTSSPGYLELLSGWSIRARSQQNFEFEIFAITANLHDLIDEEVTQLTLGYEVRSDLGRGRDPLTFSIRQGVYAYDDRLFGLIPLEAVQPDYPERAASEAITAGYCIVNFTITSTGTTKDHTVEQCSNAIFEEASIRAAESLRYRAGTRYVFGRAVETKTYYKFTFELGADNP